MCYIEFAYKCLLCDNKIMQTALTPNRHNALVCLFLPQACIYKNGAASPLQIRSGCAVCTLTAHKQETEAFHKQEEKTNMNKRILCILLAMIMVVGLLPAAAFAAEGSDAARFPYRYDARNGETAVKLPTRRSRRTRARADAEQTTALLITPATASSAPTSAARTIPAAAASPTPGLP